MATVPYPGATGITGKTEAATFIPEIWSDEIIAAYQKNLKMVPLVKKLSMTGKKGDKLHIPKPTRADASVKQENAAVNIIANTESELAIDVNRHFEYSRLIEDIVEVQALNSLRQFYTEDAGYALATKIDTDLHAVATGFGDGTMTLSPTATSYQNSAAFFNNNGTTAAFTGQALPANTAFDDGFFRDMIQKMDDNNVPMEDRCLVIPPSTRNSIMGIERYVSTDFVGGQVVQSGLIGNLYGVDVYVSNNCATIASGKRAALLFHKDAVVLAEQLSVRSQTQYKQEYLSTLYTADCLYGVQAYRPEAGFIMAVPA
ncbi:phage capsid protein [bacterium]|nr:phage capsid protein [bacterium]